MKLIIEISENIYNTIMSDVMPDAGQMSAIITRIYQGKPYEERPKGHWIENYDKTDGFTWLTCTRCMCKAYEEGYNFCPKCGALMVKEAQDE